MALWSQTHKRRSTSRNLTLICGYIWWKILRQCCRWEDYAMNLVVLIRGRQDKLPDYHNGNKVIECRIANFVHVKGVTTQKAVPSVGFSSARGNFLSGRKDVEDTMLDLLNHLQMDWKNEMHLHQLQQLEVTLRMKSSKNNFMMRNFLRLPTKRKPHCVHSLSESPNCEVCRENKNNTSHV